MTGLLRLIPLLLAFACGLTAPPTGAADLQAVPSLDLPRYMGRWYEIAKFPNRFQADCVSDTSAEYRLQPDGTVAVRNACRLATGAMKSADGQARPIGPAPSAQLQVRFAPAWLSWLPWVWGDYWVIDLDADYQLVAVSEPSREYLWVLARQPQVTPAAYDALLQRLQGQGLDTRKLERSRHKARP